MMAEGQLKKQVDDLGLKGSLGDLKSAKKGKQKSKPQDSKVRITL